MIKLCWTFFICTHSEMLEQAKTDSNKLTLKQTHFSMYIKQRQKNWQLD